MACVSKEQHGIINSECTRQYNVVEVACDRLCDDTDWEVPSDHVWEGCGTTPSGSVLELPNTGGINGELVLRESERAREREYWPTQGHPVTLVAQAH